MISIGEFSKICSTTTKTLRYYDEIGLIKPVYVNDENGYRYYDVSQLKTMLTINRLKQYELSLEEIMEILNDNSDEMLLSLMRKKENELQSKMKNYTSLLETLKKDIINLKKGIGIMSHLDKIEVKLTEQKSFNYLSSRQDMGVEDFGKYMGKMFERITKEKLTIVGCPFAIYHDKEFNPENSDIELGIPVKEAVKGTKDMPQYLCASITHKGPYSELPNCYARLVEWIENENYEIIAPPYEVYLTDLKNTKPEDYITDIFFPVKKR